MEYDLMNLIKDAHIDIQKLDEEVEFNSGKAAYIAGLLGDAESRLETAKTKLLALEGKRQDALEISLIEEKGKATVAQITSALNQDNEVVKGRIKLAEIKGEYRKVKSLFEIYCNRFGMLQTRVKMFHKESEQTQTSI